ncbi:MAG: EF-hand domain-containing protein [Burkholderiaceae bacterium]
MSTLESFLSSSARNGLGPSVISTLASQMQGKLVKKLDADSDGQVNQGEFQAALDKLSHKMGMPVTDDTQALFAGTDGNGDGQLDGSELGQMIASFLQTSANGSTVDTFGARSTAAAPNDDLAFARLDGNGDGMLTRAEFTGMADPAYLAPPMDAGMVVHQYTTYTTYSMGGMNGIGAVGSQQGWMPQTWGMPSAMGWSPAPSAPAPSATTSTAAATPPSTTETPPTATVAEAPAASTPTQPGDALNALLNGADGDKDGQISEAELSTLVAQLGAQLEAAARLSGYLPPLDAASDSGSDTAQA